MGSNETKPIVGSNKRIKAEMWDKMQYLFRNYYDRMMHSVLYYDAPIDISLLKDVIIWTTERVPIYHSKFVDNGIRPYWKTQDYTIDDILSVNLNSTDIESDIDTFIYQSIPTSSNVQWKSAVISDGKKWALCFVVNHMSSDGGDFKYILKRLTDNYNRLLEGKAKLDIKQGSRSHEAVYSKMTPEQRKHAEGLYKNISAVKDNHKFPFSPDNKELDKTMIVRRKISAELFEQFRKTGKRLGATVNDIMLAVYIQTLYEIGNYDSGDKISIPCMVDLRRYIADDFETGVTNHTGFMVCSVNKKGETINDTLIDVLRSLRKSKEDPYMGLYSLPLLKLAYGVFPHFISEFAIGIGYVNPLIGMSNIGVIKPEELSLGESHVVDGWMTGGVKYKPFVQLALTSMNGEVTMTIAIRGRDEDRVIVDNFYDILIRNIQEFVDHNKQ